MSKVQRHSHDQQTIQNILDKILNKKLSNTFPGIFGSGKTVRCPRPKDTLAITVGFFFHYYFMEMFVCVICGQEPAKPHLPIILFFCLVYLKQTVNNVVVWLQIKVQ